MVKNTPTAAITLPTKVTPSITAVSRFVVLTNRLLLSSNCLIESMSSTLIRTLTRALSNQLTDPAYHAESGEERFLVERHEDDSVWYNIFAFSRPRAWQARVGYPVARWLQHRFARDSKMAMVKAAGSLAQDNL